jgi:hypothetical protein
VHLQRIDLRLAPANGRCLRNKTALRVTPLTADTFGNDYPTMH